MSATAREAPAARGAWTLERGATVLPDGGVRFAVWAPRARRVAVRLYDADGRPAAEHPLDEEEEHHFAATVAGAEPGTDYRYVLDGEREAADPVSRWQPADVFGPSRVVDPWAFEWSDEAWRGVELADLVIYELHVGTFTPEGTFDAVIPRLPELVALGVTAVELMPVAEFPGARNWGYDGVHPFAPESSYGGPEALRRLVDAAHRHGLAVLLDVVYNHTGPEGSVLHEYGPYFIDRYRTPWGGAPNFDGPDSDEVRRYFVDNALHWVTEYHLDGLRLDATDQIYDFSARHILEELATAVHAQAAALGRRILVIAETALNDPRWVRPPERGGFGMDAQWLDDFHHAVRTAITHERAGYYGDYHGVASLAKSLAHRYVYDGVHSRHWRRRRGQPAVDVPVERFVTFIQNHDQIGNRAQGERLTDLASPAQCRLAAATLLLSPFVPLLFMGEEYGDPRPFQYFVSHQSPELVEAVRTGRAEEFAAFAWQGEVPDPQSVETFARSRPEPAARDRSPHRELYALYRELLRLRREEPRLRPGGAELAVRHAAGDDALLLHWAGRRGAPLLAALNFGSAPRDLPVPRDLAGRWARQLDTEEERFGGGGPAAARTLDVAEDAETTIRVAPHAAVLYRHDHTQGTT